tara:strand:+ start:964 stop:1737 length:774 start_codon:yes stop_codon:yes gene_type:complete
MNKINIIKIGGAVIDDEMTLKSFLISFNSLKGKKILVHGGGRKATQWSKKMNIPVKMVNGRRITDSKTLELITGIYAGQINKTLVAKLQGLGTNSLGLSGIDGNLIESKKRIVNDIDYGWVGDVININIDLLLILLNKKYVPVISPLTHDCNGQILNTNADTVSSEIAISLSKKYEVSLYYCFEHQGVMESLKDSNSLIEKIDLKMYESLLKKNILSEGMIPKIQNAFNGLNNGVKNVFIGLPEMINRKIKYTKIEL